MLKIRLTRMGKKHQPSYRIVVMPKERPVAGQYLALIGQYNPLKGETTINKELALEWLNKGAQPSDRIARLLTTAGVTHKSIVVKHYTPKPKVEEPKAEVAENGEEEPKEEAEIEEAAEEPVEETAEVAAGAEPAPTETTEETPAE